MVYTQDLGSCAVRRGGSTPLSGTQKKQPMIVNKKSQDKGTAIFSIQIPAKEVTQAYDESSEHLRKDLQVEGFRKGKVPKDIAAKHLKPENIYEHVVQHLISGAYKQILAQHSIQPISQPRVDLKSAQKDADWELELSVAVRPTVKLGDYKAIVLQVKKDKKTGTIWTPGKGEEQQNPEQDQKQREEILNEILQKLIVSIDIDISPLIIEAELNKRLARLVDDVQKIGLSMEGYLASKGETMSSVKGKFTKEIEESFKLEFILETLADEAKISVEQDELDTFLEVAKKEGDAKDVEKNAYLYASLLRRQKLFDYLLSL